MDQGRILIVDDEPYQREILRAILEKEGYETICAENGAKAVEMFERTQPDVVFTDLKLPDMEGTTVQQRIKELDRRGHEVIVFTAHGSIESAVNAIKDGAFDYLTKPLEREKLLLTARRAFERVALVRENQKLRRQLTKPLSIEGIVGKHPGMMKVLDFIKTVAPLNVTVLITGETGTGKDLVARAIHSCSNRKDRAFQSVNCAAMPETLLESELFGYERGAFTGAYSQKKGLIETCNGGTIFLDEIGELPVAPQAKLLRFLEDKKIRRIGSSDEISVDVRLIAATNRRLDEEMQKGTFRQDLFYRFRGFIIDLPPLRERNSDIYPLTQHFIEKYNLAFNKSIQDLDGGAWRKLLSYRWPGNVRQLDSVIEKAVLLAHGKIMLASDIELPQGANSSAFVFELPQEGMPLEEIERQIVAQAMDMTGGCMAQAAKLLGTTYRTMEYRAKKYGISKANQPKR